MVIPHGIHTAQDGRVFLVEHHIGHVCRCPFLIQMLRVQVVIVIACGGDDVQQSVRHADKFVAQLHHLLRIGIAVVPGIHDDILGLHGSLALGVRQGTPHAHLLAEAFHIFNIMVRKGAELLHHLLILVGIFVRANIDARPYKHGVLSFKIFLEQSVHKRIDFRIGQVEMVHTVFLASQLGFVVTESQDVSGRVNLRDDFHEVLGSLQLEIAELILGVMSVACRQAGIGVALQTESSVCLVPIIFKILLEAIVVQMDLESIHLIIGHRLGKILQISHRDELAAAVHHKAAHGIIRPVRYFSLRQSARLALLAHLEQRAGGPINTHNLGRGHHHLLAYPDGVAFLAQFFIFLQRQAEIAVFRLAGHHFGLRAEHQGIVFGKVLRNGQQCFVVIHDTHTGGGSELALLPCPLFQFGDYERLGILCIQRYGSQQEEGSQAHGLLQ